MGPGESKKKEVKQGYIHTHTPAAVDTATRRETTFVLDKKEKGGVWLEGGIKKEVKQGYIYTHRSASGSLPSRRDKGNKTLQHKPPGGDDDSDIVPVVEVIPFKETSTRKEEVAVIGFYRIDFLQCFS